MPEKENAQVQTPHDLLLERASSKYPERKFKGQIGQDGQEGQDDLEQAILDILSESDEKIAASDSKNARLVELFRTDPKSMEFVTKWVENGDPRAALVDVFGDDLSELATEEGRSQFSESLKSWRDRKAESDRLDDEAAQNWENSLAALNKWGDEKGLDNTKKAEVIARLIAIAGKALENVYEPEDFDLVLKEMNYDADVAAARHEGEVAGRNAKIAAARESRAEAGAMPPTPNGQGARVATPKPPTKKEESIWSGVE